MSFIGTKTGIISDVSVLGRTPLPDTTNISYAYSLSKVVTGYSGNAIRVREDGGGTLANIGFTSSGILDTSALLSHTGSNNGFLHTWYDQSGNTKNLTQTTNSLQPQIVNSGSVIVENSRSALKFDGVDDTLNLGSNVLTQPNTVFFVYTPTNLDDTKTRVILDARVGASASNRNTIIIDSAGENWAIAASPTALFSTAITVVNTQYLGTALFNTTASLFRIDGTQIINGTLPNNSLDGLTIGDDFTGGNEFEGYLQEVIVYNADKTSSFSTIEFNIQNFYLI